MDADDKKPEKYLKPWHYSGPTNTPLVPASPDIHNNNTLDYRAGVDFYLLIEEGGEDGFVVKLNVVGKEGYNELFSDVHEFDECLDFEHILFDQPIVLASLKEKLKEHPVRLADLGSHIVMLYIAWATDENPHGACFIVDDTSRDVGEGDKQLQFVLTVGDSPELNLTLPWSYASKYFTEADR